MKNDKLFDTSFRTSAFGHNRSQLPFKKITQKISKNNKLPNTSFECICLETQPGSTYLNIHLYKKIIFIFKTGCKTVLKKQNSKKNWLCKKLGMCKILHNSIVYYITVNKCTFLHKKSCIVFIGVIDSYWI